MRLRDLSTLQLTLSVSLLLHAALLAVRFVAPEAFDRVLRESPLEVILVNAASNEAPLKAQAIAQRSLAGGGDAELKERATSPLPSAMITAPGDSAEERQRQLDSMQAQQTTMLAQIKRQLATMPIPDPRATGTPQENQSQEEKRKELLRLLAEIERRVNEENARPKKRFVSPATREAAYAVYVDALRHRIEARGTENFPASDGKKLFGELVMMITVNFDGTLLATEVVESSGDRTLDRQAQAIVRSIGAFGRFNEGMRRQADQIVLLSRFKFTRDETLEARPSAVQ